MVSGDRIGLLADAAAMLALQKTSVRAARAWTQDGFGVSVWDVAETGLDDILLRQRLEAIVDGRIDAAERLSRVTPVKLEPTVAVRPDASPTRHRHRGPLRRPARADPRGLPRRSPQMDVSVRSAHVSTLGPQAVDVFYVQEAAAGASPRSGPPRPRTPYARRWSRPSSGRTCHVEVGHFERASDRR